MYIDCRKLAAFIEEQPFTFRVSTEEKPITYSMDQRHHLAMSFPDERKEKIYTYTSTWEFSESDDITTGSGLIVVTIITPRQVGTDNLLYVDHGDITVTVSDHSRVSRIGIPEFARNVPIKFDNARPVSSSLAEALTAGFMASTRRS